MHRISENSGTSMKADSTPTPAAPTKRPMSAVTIGRPMATTEPKAISSTMIGDADADQLAARDRACASWASCAGELGLNAAGAGAVGRRRRVVRVAWR